jgi:cell division protein FtsB
LRENKNIKVARGNIPMASRDERYQYIYGNTARAVAEPEPVEAPKKEPERRQPASRPAQRPIRSNQRVLEFNSRFTVTLSLAVTAIVVICVMYLHGQAKLDRTVSELSTKRTELTSLLSENHALSSNLDKKVDYDEIKEYARENLNMITPGEKYTIYYENAGSEYVRQYEDIPQE